MNPLQHLGGLEDRDALIGSEREQVVIAGDDDLGLSGERGSEDVIVIGIARDAGCEVGSTMCARAR